ncbi:flagellar hook-basal body complex protein [Roseomonas indoligenes]|uniref:Flagellar hook-basal body complex protein n=1 Tax=Roseomonas indoligenes TaxID=2820811 RepID=A0A940MR46_9PROT|nr:flagellar hook-basal body complex protein [Pararoseomonas indoligenes]MBP0492498.1 flagellar hook-basal body complex protein [Pararoseomonas indoligenes]
MDNPGYIALSRLVAQNRAVDVLAHNMANAETPGFRASRPVFTAYLERQREAAAVPGGESAYFTQDRATWREEAPGPVQTTGNPLDVAISGAGFFAVQTPRGERYTRAGRFSLGPEGTVVDMEGNALLGAGGNPLQMAPGDTRLVIRGDGTLRSENGEIGRIRVVRFEDGQDLVAEGSRLLAASPGQAPEPVERPALVQGAVEGSNVQPVSELTRLTAEMREFQFMAQFAEKEGDRLSGAVERILRKRS